MATADNVPSLAARTIVVAQLATARDVQRPACRTLETAAMPTLATAATVLISNWRPPMCAGATQLHTDTRRADCLPCC